MKDFNKRLYNTMFFEEKNKIKSGVYGLTQREFAYNSNKIEGSRLSKAHTASLFETRNVYSCDEEFRAKDIEETTGHFVMFNYMLNTLNEQLTERLIKEFHRCLKQGVFEDIANGYNIGEYKGRKNYVADIQTCKPQDVANAMSSLLIEYNNRPKTMETLAWFHAQYENIHPFQDGNGRTGRIILFRECMTNGLLPFIIRDVNKAKYSTLLNKAQKQEDFNPLAKYFKEEQQWYYETVKDALI